MYLKSQQAVVLVMSALYYFFIAAYCLSSSIPTYNLLGEGGQQTTLDSISYVFFPYQSAGKDGCFMYLGTFSSDFSFHRWACGEADKQNVLYNMSTWESLNLWTYGLFQFSQLRLLQFSKLPSCICVLLFCPNNAWSWWATDSRCPLTCVPKRCRRNLHTRTMSS